MTSWPILERELRVWARRGVTYWGRFTVALGGILVCVMPLLWSGNLVAPGTTGRSGFNGLVSAAFLLCCLACLLTADAISGERREGTLGLLVLTRVKHLDLLLGKLASRSLTSVLGLVALMPLLAFPLLTGGVSASEALRKALALLDTLFIALSIGLWASARGLERFRTACTALLLLAGLILGPLLLGFFLPRTHLEMASPLTAILEAADVPYRRSTAGFWFSLGLVQIMAWGFLLAAKIHLNRRVDKADESVPAGSTLAGPRTGADPQITAGVISASHPAPPAATDPAAIQCGYCGRQNGADAVFCGDCGTELRPKPAERPDAWTLSSAPTPLHWLLSRQRGLKPLLWVAAGIGCSYLAVFQVLGPVMGFGTSVVGFVPIFGLAQATIEAGLFAWAASRFLVEARRTGELELLLTTPLGAQKLLSVQWETLRRLARGPVLVMAGLPLILTGLASISRGYPPVGYWKLYYILSMLLYAANTVLGVAALFWLAPWFALQVQGQGRVIFWTVLLIRGLPYVGGFGWSLAYRPFINWGVQVNGQSGSLWFLGFLVPQWATLLLYLWLIRVARGQLLHLSGAEPIGGSQLLWHARRQITGLFRRARGWRAA